jgi:hypothetical protein
MCAPTGTCEVPGTVIPDAPIDTPINPDACVPALELCGDAIDQDCDGVDPTCPDNDRPGGAIDVSAGGDFTVDLTFAHDDASPSGPAFCGATGGRDVFYKVSVASDTIYYFDTFGSDFDTVIRVYPGACQSGAVAANVCHNDQCSTLQTQWVGRLSGGDNCVVIDQKDGTVTGGHVMLHVENGVENGPQLPIGVSQVSTGTTSGRSDDTTATCGGGAPDVGYYFATCPGTTTLDATTCSAGTAYDTTLYVLGPGQTEIACADDDAACAANPLASTLTGVSLSGAHLYWVVVDGTAVTDVGAFTLTTTTQ